MSWQNIVFGTEEFYTYTAIFIGSLVLIMVAYFILIYGLMFAVDALLNLIPETKEKQQNRSVDIKDFISDHGFLIYFVVATIVVILIAIFSDGSGPYTGGGGDDYIWKPGRR